MKKLKKETSTLVIDAKYSSILAKEESWAKAVAIAVMKSKPISVWEVLIPIIFIINFIKKNDDRDLLIRNLLFTKKLALDAAMDMVKNGRQMEDVVSRINDSTSKLLNSSDVKGIYSDEIRRNQMKEINLLIDHYCRLLDVEGADYASLVTNAYHGLNEYLLFLEKLGRAEKEVTLAALRTMGPKADNSLVSKMEETANRVRMAEAEKIFGTPN